MLPISGERTCGESSTGMPTGYGDVRQVEASHGRPVKSTPQFCQGPRVATLITIVTIPASIAAVETVYARLRRSMK